MKHSLMITAALLVSACATTPATQPEAFVETDGRFSAGAAETVQTVHVITGAPEDAVRYCHDLVSKHTRKIERVCATRDQWLEQIRRRPNMALHGRSDARNMGLSPAGTVGGQH